MSRKMRAKPKPRVAMSCLICGKNYTIRASRYKKGEGRYCSRSCSGKSIRNRVQLECIACGTTFDRRRDRVKKVNYCSKECMGSHLRGKLHPKWRGGQRGIRSSIEYKEWRIEQLKLADYTCEYCLERGGKLQVHHILSLARYPDAAILEDNGAVLCIDCHNGFHKLYGRLDFTGGDYFEWLSTRNNKH